MTSGSVSDAVPPYPGPVIDTSQSQFRLLLLDPAHSLDSTIVANLAVVSLKHLRVDPPRPKELPKEWERRLLEARTGNGTGYEALSYTWGPRIELRTIQLNGTANYPVTDNLYYALRRLRKETEVRTLWVDAVCINQQDIAERNEQVGIMGNIYFEAFHVLVFLGESERQSAVAADEQHVETSGSIAKKERPQSFRERFKRSLPASSFSQRSRHMIAVLEYTQPYWWQRAWVIQEAVMAHELTVHFGPCAMQWDYFADLIEEMVSDAHKRLKSSKRQDKLQTCPADSDRRETIRQHLAYARLMLKDIRMLRQMGQLFRGQAFARTMGNIAIFSRDAQSTLQHDKVYSILGIVPSKTARLIVPDYGKPVHRVFCEATRAAIASSGNLDILGVVCFGDAHSGTLPTWAADFNKLIHPLFKPYDELTKITESWGSPENWEAELPQKADDSEQLGLKGYILDEIVEVENLPEWGKYVTDKEGTVYKTTPSPDRIDPENEQDQAYIRLIAKAIHHAARTPLSPLYESPTTPLRPQRIPLNLMQISLEDLTAQLPTLINNYKDWRTPSIPAYKHLHKFTHASFPVVTSWLGKAFQLWEDFSGLLPTTPRWERRWYPQVLSHSVWNAQGSVLVRTARGFVGVAARGVHARDNVVLVPGGRLPLILSSVRDGEETPRRDTRKFRFRGFAYVHGTMRSEIVRNGVGRTESDGWVEWLLRAPLDLEDKQEEITLI